MYPCIQFVEQIKVHNGVLGIFKVHTHTLKFSVSHTETYYFLMIPIIFNGTKYALYRITTDVEK